ncbi:MAG: hypothetical protein GTO02_07725, partial [Candidatus Dadabacteria bacterium]|nr:hypothetical protein [Candidatus Dadabacteria bacterium]
MPAHPQTITLDSFKGLNNKDKPERTPIDFLKEALNIDIDSAGGIRKREGYSKQISGVFHSLWSNGEDVCLAVKDGDLVRITSNLNTILIKAGVGNDKISYDIIGDDIYFTSISINGILNRNTNKVREWGLQSPNPIPSITSSNGILPSGTFQVVTTFLDKFGRESGASPLQTIDLQKDKSIVLSGFSVPTNSDIISRNIYVSSQNGSHLFLNKTIPINQTTTTIDDTFSNIVPLKTIGVSSAPRGYIVKHAHGRMWVADDKVLWFSDALTYDWFRFS